MPEISSLPEEVLLHIFSFLPTSSLISVRGTSTQWQDLSSRPLAARIQSSWANPRYYPSAAEVRCAAALVTSGYLPEDVMTKFATTRIQSWPSVAEVRCAAALAATGHLTSLEQMQLLNKDISSLARVARVWVKLVIVTGDLGPNEP